ncbi:MAG: DUF4258 domain-containing protein [Candidatus Hydrogenedentes bacterium]|nr:DUF4258 domain-containing protein [Candidatus Hydrogenedentota bacterium]
MNTVEKSVIFSGHALTRMFERSLSKEQVIEAIKTGTIIERYPDDYPLPSALSLAFVDDVPIHVVYATDSVRARTIVVTVYIPDPARWSPTFDKRLYQ